MDNEQIAEATETEAPSVNDLQMVKVIFQDGREEIGYVSSETVDELTLETEFARLILDKQKIRVEQYADVSQDAPGTLRLRDQMGMKAIYVKSEPNVWRLVWNMPGEHPSNILPDEYMTSATKTSFEELQARYQ